MQNLTRLCCLTTSSIFESRDSHCMSLSTLTWWNCRICCRFHHAM